jgi:hypothetical protein
VRLLQQRAQEQQRRALGLGRPVVAGVERAGARVVGELEVRQRRRRGVEELGQRLLLVDQRAGGVGEPGDVGGQALPVLGHEGRDLAEGDRQPLDRARQVLPLAGQLVGDHGQVAVELPHDVVAVGDRRREVLQVVHGAEQVVALVRQRGDGLGEVLQRRPEQLAVALEVVGADAQQVLQRAVLVGPVGAEGDVEVVERGVDLVQLEGDLGAVLLDELAVGQHLAAGVGGRELHVPVADDRGGDDQRLGVGRDLVLLVVLERDQHAVAARLDRGDLADLDAEDADVALLVQADRALEDGGRALGAAVAERAAAGQGGGDAERHQQRAQAPGGGHGLLLGSLGWLTCSPGHSGPTST